MKRQFNFVLEIHGRADKGERDKIEEILEKACKEIKEIEGKRDRKVSWQYFS